MLTTSVFQLRKFIHITSVTFSLFISSYTQLVHVFVVHSYFVECLHFSAVSSNTVSFSLSGNDVLNDLKITAAMEVIKRCVFPKQRIYTVNMKTWRFQITLN